MRIAQRSPSHDGAARRRGVWALSLALGACAPGVASPKPPASSAPSASSAGASASSAGGSASAAGASAGAAEVAFEAIAPGVWLHRSVKHLPEYGDVPSNGLVVRADTGALIVDTAWTPSQTAELLDWTAAHVGPVRAVLVTHWHDDRSGGLVEVHRRGIASHGSRRTAREARAHGATPPTNLFDDSFDLRAVGIAGEAHFAGAGHSLDNIVVWLADAKLLFGGCLLKSAAATSLGNTADGDLQAWATTVVRLQARYANATTVIPGHGAAGGPELLTHTLELLASLAPRGDAREPMTAATDNAAPEQR